MLADDTAFDVDAQISACSAAQLTNELCKLGISVAEAVHTTAIAALTEAMNDPRLDHKVSFKVSNNDRSDDLLVKFTAKDASFKFWHTMSRPGSGMDLDIVPGYHPVMYGRTYDFLINGDTDALIGAKAVRYVYPPDSAKGPRDDTYLSSRWVNIDHPVFVQGQSFEAVVIPRHIVTEEGLETLVKLLSDAMSSNGNYVGVCGGFRSSLPYPSNVLSQLRTLPPRGEARGSEGRCVWTYRTLVKEGALQNAYVPRWFVDEGWLQAYAVDTDH